MADNDDGRVESRLAAIGRGFSATPERIAKLQAQAEALAKQPTGKPERSFSRVLGERPAPKLSRRAEFRDKRQASLPQKGPVPTGASLRLKHKLEEDLTTSEKKSEFVVKG